MGTLFISFLQSPLNNNKGKSIFPFRLQKAALIVYNSYVMKEVRGRGFNTDMGNKEETETVTDKSITTPGQEAFNYLKALLLLSRQLVRGARPLQKTHYTLITVSFLTLTDRVSRRKFLSEDVTSCLNNTTWTLDDVWAASHDFIKAVAYCMFL